MADTLNKLEQDSLAVASETGYRKNTSFRIGNLFWRILQFFKNLFGGTYLLGKKNNVIEIKAIANPTKGDTWQALDTSYYWTYDGKEWNNIGLVLPSDAAIDGGTRRESLKSVDDKILSANDLLGINTNITDKILLGGYHSSVNGGYTSDSDWFTLERQRVSKGRSVSVVKMDGAIASGVRVLFWNEDDSYFGIGGLLKDKPIVSPIDGFVSINFINVPLSGQPDMIAYSKEEILTFSLTGVTSRSKILDTHQADISLLNEALSPSSEKDISNADLAAGNYHYQNGGFSPGGYDWLVFLRTKASMSTLFKITRPDGSVVTGYRVLTWDKDGKVLDSIVPNTTEDVVLKGGGVEFAINFRVGAATSAYPQFTKAEILTFTIHGAGAESKIIKELQNGIATASNDIESLRLELDNLEVNSVANRGVLLPQNGTVFLSGASFAIPSNGWFELMCESLGATAINKAVGGEIISHTANKMYAGTLWTAEQFEQHDAFVIMHVYDKDNINGNLKDNYEDYQLPFDTDYRTLDFAAAYDYVIKRYMDECYKQKDNPSSKWYGTQHGKPCQIILSTHWHDSRTLHNKTIRELCLKWGLALIEFDTNIGWSRFNLHPSTKQQTSRLYETDSQTINGVTYANHFLQGKTQYIQRKMAAIAKGVFEVL